MIKIAHLVMVPMTGVGVNNGYKGDEWFKYRINIFKEYTLKSLAKQENKNHIIWLTFRPEDEKSPLIDEIVKAIEDAKVPAIMTFHGLMYKDDKFVKDFNTLLKNKLRIARQAWREKRFWFMFPAWFGILFSRKNATLPKRLERALYEIRTKLPQLSDCSYIYLTRIDSDDMFHRQTLAEVERIQPFEGALVYKNGYVYNSNTGEMAEWQPKTNPPFHTIIFLASRFFNPVEHIEYYKHYKSHEDVTSIWETKTMEDGRYCVVVHGNHISTVWNHPFRGELVDVNKLNEFK